MRKSALSLDITLILGILTEILISYLYPFDVLKKILKVCFSVVSELFCKVSNWFPLLHCLPPLSQRTYKSIWCGGDASTINKGNHMPNNKLISASDITDMSENEMSEMRWTGLQLLLENVKALWCMCWRIWVWHHMSQVIDEHNLHCWNRSARIRQRLIGLLTGWSGLLL